MSPTTKTLMVGNSFTFSASGGAGSYTYAVVTGGGGTFSGATYTAPASAGTYTVKVTDGASNTASATVTVNAALAISPTTKTVAVGNSTSFTATGGVPPYSYSKVSGSGAITTGGSYTAPGSASTDTVRVTDSLNNTNDATITVNPALAISPTTKSLMIGNAFAFSASAGSGGYVYSVVTGGGGSFSGNTYTAPNTAGTYTVKVMDGASNTATAIITVNAALAISPATKTVAVGNTAAFSATGGVGPYSYSKVSGSGAITTGGSYTAPASAGTATVRVTDSLNNTNDATITVNPALAISPTTKNLMIGNTFAFSASAGAGGYVYSVVTGGGGSFSGNTYTAPNTAGAYTIKVTDNMGNLSNATVTVSPGLAISPATKILVIGSSFSFSASGGVGSYTYSVVTAAGGTFSGNTYTAPSIAGTYTVRVTDTLGNTSNATVTASPVLAISPSSKTLAVGNGFTFSAVGGISPYTFSANSGTINSTSGHFVAPGTTVSSTVTVTDSASQTSSATVTINPALSISPSSITLIAGQTATFTGSGGVPPYTFSDPSSYINSSSGVFMAQYNGNITPGIVTATVTDSVGNSSSANVTVRAFQTAGSFGNAIAIDSAGNIYTAGLSGASWITRKSTNGGTTWTTVDTYQYTAGQLATAYGIAIDSSNNIYVVGIGSSYWIVRKSTNGGTSWSTVDAFTSGTMASAVTIDGSGNIYVVGWTGAASFSHWVVRKSTNDGTSWSTIDNFQYCSSAVYPTARATSIVIDSAGNIYTAGWGDDINSVPHWLVRVSSNGGTSWTTTDNFQTAGGTSTFANAIIADSANNIYVAGEVLRKFTASTSTWSTVSALSGLSGLIFGGTINGLALDSQSNIYLVGGTAWTTVIFNTTSNTVAAIDQVAWGSNNAAYGVVIDSTGRPYVVGSGLRILSP